MKNNEMKTKRPTSEYMEDIFEKQFDVLDKGFIRVVDYMGTDQSIVQMARVSYGQGTKTVNEDRGLIRYLIRNLHTSPLEGCELKLHIKMPIFVMRQWIRHRMASVNEYSARYSEMKDERFIPEHEEVLGQDKVNKQGSAGEISEDMVDRFIENLITSGEISYAQYKDALAAGVAREMARAGLPLNTYTECYWKMDLHNLLHFCKLRSDPHAQKEIRVYSDIILHEIIKGWLPHVYEAFIDYVYEGKRFSRMEMEVIKGLINQLDLSVPQFHDLLREEGVTSANEANEFLKKIGRV